MFKFNIHLRIELKDSDSGLAKSLSRSYNEMVKLDTTSRGASVRSPVPTNEIVGMVTTDQSEAWNQSGRTSLATRLNSGLQSAYE